MTRRIIPVAGLLAIVLIGLGPLAPDVHWMTVTKFEMTGGAGRVVSFVAGLAGESLETVEEVFLAGNRMRTDRDKTSTIVDIDARTFTEVRHDDKSYQVIPFDHYQQAAESAAEMMTDVEAEPVSPEADDAERQPEREVTLDLDVDRAGDSKDFFGQRAERWYVTITATSEPAQGADEDMEEEGMFVILADTWLAEQLPGEDEMKAFQERLQAALLDGLKLPGMEDSESFADMMEGSEGFAEALARLEEEMEGMDGSPVLTVTYIVSVPPDMEFDRDEALGIKKKSTGSRLGGLARGLARRARGNDDEDAPKQATLFKITTELTRAELGGVGGDTFTIPSDYRLIEAGAIVDPR